jgi:hypothetical protein
MNGSPMVRRDLWAADRILRNVASGHLMNRHLEGSLFRVRRRKLSAET